jgi:two-component system chemotaxis response regulator CheB
MPLKKGCPRTPHIEVVGCAGDPWTARDQIVLLRPDVITLDVDMPRMGGLEFLKKLMPQFPIPTVMVSAFTERGARITMDALEAGAVDFVTKPRADRGFSMDDMLLELRTKIIIAGTVDVSGWKDRKKDFLKTLSIKGSYGPSRKIVVAMGASTGGTEALKKVLMSLHSNCPAIAVVQHMPEGFTKAFAKRLNTLCLMEVKEAEDGENLEPGLTLIAPGNRHMEIFRSKNGGYHVRLTEGENVSGHKPSVDVLMRSVAECARANGRGVLLTGMGADGAEGMLEMKKNGAVTFAQDEQSSVVFGMPKKAWEIGAVDKLLPLELIAENLMESCM